MTVSEGHHWPPPKGSGLNDRGGPFYTTKSYVKNPGASVPVYLQRPGDSPNPDYVYSGKMSVPYTLVNGSYFPPASASSDAELDKLGATAIARCEPTNPIVDASTFLGELLKDGLPALVGSSVWKSKTDSARKKAADEYLNVQFGWMPIVRDVTKFGEAVRHAEKVMTQYERDAGKVVRRRYNFPTTRTELEEQVYLNSLMEINGGVSNVFVDDSPRGRVMRKKVTTRRQWFSGAFTYYLPRGYDSREEMANIALRAEKLFGVSLTPETLWNIAPWSWAVDWFSNTGDVINNINAFGSGGLIMPYGYICEHTVTEWTYTTDARSIIKKGYRVDPPPPLCFVTETKKRRQANPYGFGVSWDSLSGFQASILGALGISRRS